MYTLMCVFVDILQKSMINTWYMIIKMRQISGRFFFAVNSNHFMLWLLLPLVLETDLHQLAGDNQFWLNSNELKNNNNHFAYSMNC